MESWQERLTAGDVDSAWKEFVGRYEKLILATIRRTLGDDDDVADVSSEVYASLSSDSLRRLSDGAASATARFSTWLVAVVHHQAIDWVRKRDGRRRFRPPPGLTDVQLHVFQSVFIGRRSHSEAYELLRQQTDSDLSFGAFLKIVAETYRRVEAAKGKAATGYFAGPPESFAGEDESPEERLIRSEAGDHLAKALAVLEPAERLAVQLFVVNRLSADRVARIVGWPNPKAVYNRVYRALSAVREELTKAGVNRSNI